MQNKDIKYELSTDYERLYQLLKGGNILVGYIALDNYRGGVNMEYSKLTHLIYNATYEHFDLGFTFFEVDFDKNGFMKLCSENNVRFIDINETTQTETTETPIGFFQHGTNILLMFCMLMYSILIGYKVGLLEGFSSAIVCAILLDIGHKFKKQHKG